MNRTASQFRRIFLRMACVLALPSALVLPSAFALALDASPAPDTVVKAQTVTVFAAASLKNALDEISALWKKRGGGDVALSYAASFPLARQIESGAPADLFISADEPSMNYLADKALVVVASRENLLGNELVVVAPKDAKLDKLDLTMSGIDAALAGGRLAMGDPASVPAGKYGKDALEKLGVWSGVQAHLALADNVRSALLYVSRGETPLGIVYATDARAAPDVKIVATFPVGTHAPIVYPVALTTVSKSEAAKKFLAFLNSATAAAAFTKQGFTVLARPAN